VLVAPLRRLAYIEIVVQRLGIIWVIDSPTGHLAIASRGGYLLKLLGEPTRLFPSVDQMLAALPPKFPPTALVFGYAEIAPAVTVILHAPHPSLEGIPVYIADAHGDWPLDELPSDRVFTFAGAGSTISYQQGLEWFRDRVLGASG
jgi:hypothetical protein